VRIVVALGGNALLERDERPDAVIQRWHVRQAAAALAPLAADHQLVLCHGNGPQVGMLALESQADTSLSRPYPLDVLVAQTQGMIGYWMVQELRNAGVAQRAACLVSQTIVDPADPAFSHPTKFIGASYAEPDARALAARLGWTIAADGARWRRVVASPRPLRLVEIETVRALADAGVLVVCGGGGGVPVVRSETGELTGADAVVDKDLTAAELAITLKADRLLVLTDVPAVIRDYGRPDARPIDTIDTDALAALTFPAGSMGPKVEACIRFARATGHPAAIGALTDAAGILAGRAGTTITPGSAGRTGRRRPPPQRPAATPAARSAGCTGTGPGPAAGWR
jgi:carbamate kinase